MFWSSFGVGERNKPFNRGLPHFLSNLHLPFKFHRWYFSFSANIYLTVQLWAVLSSGTCLKTLVGHSRAVTAVLFSRDGTLVISCSYDSKCCVWDVLSGCCLKSISVSQQSHLPISHATISPNGKYLLISTLDSTLTMWDYKIGQGRIIKTYQGIILSFCPVISFHYLFLEWLASNFSLQCHPWITH